MQTKLYTLRILIIFFVLQKESDAARCYQCNSKIDRNCNSTKIDRRYLKPCPTSHQFCRKAVYVYYFTEPRQYFTIRECAKWGSGGGKCYRGRYKRDTYQLVYECRGAGCNRSSITSRDLTVLYIFSPLIMLTVLILN